MGGEEACGIPGGGEEDKDRGREVQGGVDEAQRRGRKRWAAALVAGTRTGSQGRGASSGVAGDGNGRGPDDLAADAPPVTFWRGGSLFPPPFDRRGAVDGDGSNSGDKKRKSNRSY